MGTLDRFKLKEKTKAGEVIKDARMKQMSMKMKLEDNGKAPFFTGKFSN